MLALREAGCGAGSFFSLVYDFCMSLGRNLLLLHQHFSACGAMLALREAGCGAGRFFGFVNDFRMSLRRNHLLLLHHPAAGAVLPLGETRVRAGGLLGWVRDPVVADCGYVPFLIIDELLARGVPIVFMAVGAFIARYVPGVHTGGFDGVDRWKRRAVLGFALVQMNDTKLSST